MHVKNNVSKIYKLSQDTELLIPVINSRVAAGFPSPAEDYVEKRIDLNERLIKHPFATYFIDVEGDSMEPLICDGQMVIVDRMIEPINKDIVVARFGNDFCVKRLRIFNDGILLCSENPFYKPIPVGIEDDFEIWGKVMHTVRSF